jgi:hypothetical protein
MWYKIKKFEKLKSILLFIVINDYNLLAYENSYRIILKYYLIWEKDY